MNWEVCLSPVYYHFTGQAKRFQPNKPSTKAQAAVSLTSGRMEEYIQSELSKLEAENSSRLMAMEEIKTVLLDRGEIQRIWESKMEVERSRGFEVEWDYLASVRDLEEEKIVQENAQAELLRQKAALDCQKQLLSSLKEEVDEMSERLAFEKSKHVDEQSNLSGTLQDLQVKHEALLDAKSLLEAEIEALRKLRYKYVNFKLWFTYVSCYILQQGMEFLNVEVQ